MEELEYMVVLPNNDKRVKYQLNGNEETYSKSLEDMEKMIMSNLPITKRHLVNQYLFEFQFFLVDFLKKEVIPLEIEKDIPYEEKRKYIDNMKKKQLEEERRKLLSIDPVKTINHTSQVGFSYWKK